MERSAPAFVPQRHACLPVSAVVQGWTTTQEETSAPVIDTHKFTASQSLRVMWCFPPLPYFLSYFLSVCPFLFRFHVQTCWNLKLAACSPYRDSNHHKNALYISDLNTLCWTTVLLCLQFVSLWWYSKTSMGRPSVCTSENRKNISLSHSSWRLNSHLDKWFNEVIWRLAEFPWYSMCSMCWFQDFFFKTPPPN